MSVEHAGAAAPHDHGRTPGERHATGYDDQTRARLRQAGVGLASSGLDV